MTPELPKAYDPALIEEKWARFWVGERLFDVPTPAPASTDSPVILSAARSAQSKDPETVPPSQAAHPFSTSNPEALHATPNAFVQLLPPPNVTGRLHMGHMLNQTEMDILTRWHRMLGDTALWVPGTDHAGIATQMMVERQLAAEGKSRTDFTRDQFTERVWQWKHQYGSAITEQMKRLGASVDWSREYFTMDDRLSVAVREAFVRLWNQGLIYRGAYIVNWDPEIQTAVSDLEVESEERPGHLYHIRYNLADGPLSDGTASITIATTRPETLLGDTAVAVNPNDPRYQHLIGKLLTLPLSAAAENPDRTIPILADDWANPEFGTGAVKVTPAHDPNDFAIGQRHNLPSPSIMDARARIDLPGSPYDKLDRFEARKRIVADLEAIGALVAIKDHALTLPISQRTGAVIEPRLSMQWFLSVNKTPNATTTPGAPSSPTASSSAKVGSATDSASTRNSIAANAIAAVRDGHIKFTPEMYTKTYNEWMSNLHDWCLSRQLWWGHRIPAWHCSQCAEINVALEAPTVCSNCSSTNLTQETDVLDTWFSSGLLPFTVFGWPGNTTNHQQPPTGHPQPTTHTASTPDLAAFYPTSLLVTGSDILFFWVARMIMLGCHFMLDVPLADGAGGLKPRTLADAVPFREVYIHALVRDADRQKMSKTKGNVVDPIEIITKYGTDAVRFTLASQASPGTDIAFNEARTEGYRAFANKIWNAARFLQMNIDRAREAGYTVSLPGNDTAQSEAAQSNTAKNDPAKNSVILSGAEAQSHRASAESKDPDGLSPAHTAQSLSPTPLETRWIFSRLSAVSDSVAHSLAAYRFDEAANAIYQFFWGEFCDWYLELVKLRLNFEEPHNPTTALTLNALVTVFEAALRLLSPFMPFLTEELWHALYASIEQPVPTRSIALTRFPLPGDFFSDAASVSAMNALQELITLARNARKQAGVPEKESTALRISTLPQLQQIITANADIVSRQTRSTEFQFVDHLPPGGSVVSSSRFDVEPIYERQIDVPAERERLTKDLAKFNKGLEAADKQLSNEGFIARAPAPIVEGLRKQHAETLALKQKAEAALAALPPE
jgi:valyl-tRNA synthetase